MFNRLYFKCDKHTKHKLQRIAKSNHRSLSNEVEYIISMYIDNQPNLHFINNGTIYNIGTIKNQFIGGIKDERK